MTAIEKTLIAVNFLCAVHFGRLFLPALAGFFWGGEFIVLVVMYPRRSNIKKGG